MCGSEDRSTDGWFGVSAGVTEDGFGYLQTDDGVPSCGCKSVAGSEIGRSDPHASTAIPLPDSPSASVPGRARTVITRPRRHATRTSISTTVCSIKLTVGVFAASHIATLRGSRKSLRVDVYLLSMTGSKPIIEL